MADSKPCARAPMDHIDRLGGRFVCVMPRTTHRPTAEQIFRLFSLTQRHILEHDGHDIRTFEPEMTGLQQQVLALLGVPDNAYSTGR